MHNFFRLVKKAFHYLVCTVHGLGTPQGRKLFRHFVKIYVAEFDEQTEKKQQLAFQERQREKVAHIKQLNEFLSAMPADKPSFLLVSHELSRTGAPQALLYMALEIKKIFGVTPVILSPKDGPLRKNYEEQGFCVLTDPLLVPYWNSPFTAFFVSQFSLVIVNSLILCNFISYYGTYCQRLVHWLHETKDVYMLYVAESFASQMPHVQSLPYTIWCGSMLSLPLSDLFRKKGRMLLYGVPEISIHDEETVQSDKITFLIAGEIQHRKGQKIFVEAIALLPEKLRKKGSFLIVGSMDLEPTYVGLVKRIARPFPEIRFLPNMPLDDLFKLYRQSDVLVSASLNDPMPLVVTYGLMFGMPCLISDAIGQARLLRDERPDAVDIVPAGDARSLAARMADYIEHPKLLDAFRTEGRAAYDAFFSMQGFSHNLERLIREELHNDQISSS
jgi:glycosyltransferase involved in cell wall biosynthesis